MSYSVHASLGRSFKPLKENKKRNPVVFVVVVFGHVLALWLLIYLHRPYQLSAPPQVNAIKVHFVSMSKSDDVARHSATAQHAAPEQPTQPQPKLEKPIAPAKTKPVEQVKTVTSRQSDKTVIRSQEKNEPVQKNELKESTPAASSAISIQENKVIPQIQTSPNAGKAKAIEGSKQQEQASGTAQGEGQRAGGSKEGQDKMLSQAKTAPIAQESPILVNSIDVLSFPLKYQDRELQNQDRQGVLTIFVDRRGYTTKVLIKQSTGIDYLDQQAVKAAQKARFKPHKVNGQAVPIFVNLPIDFRMNQRGRG